MLGRGAHPAYPSAAQSSSRPFPPPPRPRPQKTAARGPLAALAGPRRPRGLRCGPALRCRGVSVRGLAEARMRSASPAPPPPICGRPRYSCLCPCSGRAARGMCTRRLCSVLPRPGPDPPHPLASGSLPPAALLPSCTPGPRHRAPVPQHPPRQSLRSNRGREMGVPREVERGRAARGSKRWDRPGHTGRERHEKGAKSRRGWGSQARTAQGGRRSNGEQ